MNFAEAILNEASRQASEEDPRTGVHPSDSGRCALEFWADRHRLLTIPQDPNIELNRFWLGKHIGADLAAIAMRAILHDYPDTQPGDIEIEYPVSGKIAGIEVTGSIDLLWKPGGIPRLVVEFKTNYNSRATQAPPDYQVLQAATYALLVPCEDFVIVTDAPAVQRVSHNGKKVLPVQIRQDEYKTADWKDRVEAEVQRLDKALDMIAPAPDPQQPWRCEYCRYGDCAKNRNPLK